jgi:hypothetical protein
MPGPASPVIVLNYMLQQRISSNEIKPTYALNDKLSNYLINISYRRSFWGIDHNFRAFYNYNKRLDKIRSDAGLNFYNYMFGLNEGLSKAFSINADYGQTVIKNSRNSEISHVTTYSFFAEWQTQNRKFYTSAGVSNNQVMPTLLSVDSYRLATIVRMGYRFYKSMGLDLEMGYSPYKEKLKDLNDYSEKYVYLRYLYDFNFR